MSASRTVLGVVAVLAVASVGPGLAGGARPPHEAAEDPAGLRAGSVIETQAPNESATVVQTVTYRNATDTTGSIVANHSYRIGENVSALVVYDYDHGTVLESDGFTQQSNGRWTWDGETAAATLTVRVSVNQSSRHFSGLRWVDVGNWTLANPRTDFAYRDGDRSEWVYSWQDAPSIDRRTRVVDESRGFAGQSVVYLGAYDTETVEATNQTFRLVRPESAEMADSPEAVLRSLRSASRHLRVGARDEVVNAFAGPSPLRHGGTAAMGADGRQDFWASASADAEAPTSIWVHEYVHTRQSFVLGPEMAWFREACASYYAAVLSLRAPTNESGTFSEFRDVLARDDGANATLSNRSSWSSTYVPYTKGTRVLAALDGRIRNATDGERTLQDAFRRLNRRDEAVTADVFASVLADVSGESQQSWLETHVHDGERASPPRSPYAYTAPGGAHDADDDGLNATAERRHGSHPFRADTDGDGVEDGAELRHGTDPTDPYSTLVRLNGTSS